MCRFLVWGCLVFLFFSSVRINALDQKSLPEPYADIELLPFNPHGWYVNEEPVKELIDTYQPRTIIEVGSWMGVSTRHMASLLPEGGKVYAIDTWLGTGFAYDPDLVTNQYDQFLSNVIHAGLTDRIIPCRMDSLKAASRLNVIADFIYLDATHEYIETLQDLNAWYPHLKEGGIFCGDDWGWGAGGVEKAVRQFTSEKQIDFYTNGWFWYFIKEANPEK